MISVIVVTEISKIGLLIYFVCHKSYISVGAF